MIVATPKEPTKLSIVFAMYNVAGYLPKLFESLDAQEPGDYELECIFVDDGSPDDCATAAEEWLDRSAHSGVVVRQENGGVSSARNAGIDAATGAWISFPDPDDFFGSSYFKDIATYIRSNRGASAVAIAANIVRYFEATNSVRDSHALRFKFRGSAKNVDLRRSPHYIQLSMSSSFVRSSEFTEAGVRFSVGLANAEDSVLMARILANSAAPIVAVVPSAHYYYRKRATGDSAVDRGVQSADGHMLRFKLGYIPLFRDCAPEGYIPEWMANVLLYGLRWNIHRELKAETAATFLTASEKNELLQLISDCLQYVKPEWILGYRVTNMSIEVRYLLVALCLRDDEELRFPTHGVRITALDQPRNLMRLNYYFVGDLPHEEFRVRARPITPYAAKTRTIDLFGQTRLRERIVWLAANSWLAVDLNGRRQEILFDEPEAPAYALTERAIWTHFDADRPRPPAPSTHGREPVADNTYRRARRIARRVLNAVGRRTDALRRPSAARSRTRLEASARGWPAAARFKSAWVFADRLDRANDNAEHLYRYVTSHDRDINAWYVLRKDSPDWTRLRRDGFRLVEAGSQAHAKLMLNAANLISSHADKEIVDPINLRLYGERRGWRFVYLRHGVSTNDMSRWLNTKKIDLCIASSDAEFRALTGDNTPYRLTTKEVSLTGLPRHDRLKRVHERVEHTPRMLLVAPTWRSSLSERDPSTGRRLPLAGFESSEYAVAWLRFLRSAELKAVSDDHDLEIVLLPHPNAEPSFSSVALPAHVRRRTYADGDVQELLAASSLLVTDYSSVAFDAGYLGTPTVYFQFDAERFFGGAHTMTAGYFDFVNDGFGPVVQSAEDAASAIRALLEDRGEPRSIYEARMKRTFPARDGRNCERVFEAIKNLDRPVPYV